MRFCFVNKDKANDLLNKKNVVFCAKNGYNLYDYCEKQTKQEVIINVKSISC